MKLFDNFNIRFTYLNSVHKIFFPVQPGLPDDHICRIVDFDKMFVYFMKLFKNFKKFKT